MKYSGTDAMIYKNIFAGKNCEKLAFLTQNKAKLCKIWIMHWFVRKTPFLPKIGKNRRKL
jgi:hypothetical protein